MYTLAPPAFNKWECNFSLTMIMRAATLVGGGFLEIMKITCSYCGKKTEKSIGHYNRAIKLGAKLFCSRRCFGLNRRVDESPEDKKRIKYFYDSFLYLADPERYKAESAAWFKKDYAQHPEKYKKVRQSKKEEHAEYCRRPEYKEYKHQYDVQRHHKSMYGEFWEASIILTELEKEIDNRLAKMENGIYNKSQKRKRLWQKIQAKQNLSSLLQI